MRQFPVIKIKITSLVVILIFSFFSSNAQQENFRFDTIVGKYLMRVTVYQEKLDDVNIKAYFTFYDSSKAGKLQFIYYFKFLPPLEITQNKRYVPIFQDWINRDNSRYLWSDISHGEFDYNKMKEYVLKQNERNNMHRIDSFTVSEKELKKNATQQFLIAFNGLMKKDYLTFVKSIHPAELGKENYELKATYYKEINRAGAFKFTAVTVDSVGKLVNFFGELQTILYTTCAYEINNKAEKMKQNIIARSFDKGNIWYFKEIMKNKGNSYYDMSKGNLNEPAISWEIIKHLK